MHFLTHEKGDLLNHLLNYLGEILPPIPEELKIMDPPLSTLYYQGSNKARQLIDQLPHRGLAVVGTRNPQNRSVLFLQEQIKILGATKFPLVIISGLARGIDSYAHWAALEAGLPTIAIVSTGLDRCYPPENSVLRDRILAADGLIISEYPPEAPLYRSHFLRRNRIIAGWGRATWVVEAGVKSGALNTAKWAREQNKICLATPGFPGDYSLAGNQTLLDRDHAIPYWGVHSLGSIWLDLATCIGTGAGLPLIAASPGPNRRRSRGVSLQIPLPAMVFESNEDLTLKQEIARCTEIQGGVSVHDLFDWAVERNWQINCFYATLDRLVQREAITQMGSILLFRR